MTTHWVRDILISIRRAEVAELVDLRHAVLRGGLPRSEAIFPGDEASSARHYGAFDQSTGVSIAVACATVHLNHWLDESAWQLRGMATSSDFRGSGLGAALLNVMESDVLADRTAPRLLWANARTPALGFYQRLGWKVMSAEFEIPTAGPHFCILKRL